MARRKAPTDDERRRLPLEGPENEWVRDRKDDWTRRRWLTGLIRRAVAWASAGVVGFVAFRDALSNALEWIANLFRGST